MQQSASSPFSPYGEKPQLGLDIDYGQDLASGAAFFQSDGRKHDDLKQMLDSNKDGLKLEAMKRIISMIARGRDASELFPAVVKNVVSKNIEVKKLVYVYLVRYAEEQQDLALLSISTFQRALKDPNQLIRASALRVLSSIRVGMIAPILMLAIRDSAADLSPYVRKTAAHAIPKLYSLDPDQKEELVNVIDKLLSDKTTLVVGSAVMAFEEVCPEKVELIHKNYRKLCNLLVDVDEWGQVIIINMLTRYARTQFADPNADDPDDMHLNKDSMKNESFYNESSASSSSDSDEENKRKSKKETKKKRRTASSSPIRYHVDLDHRLLLRQTKPLLQSRNASVVMAVAQLYHHIAPSNEVHIIVKALIRLLRSYKEVQSVVLTCIASMTTKRKAIFEPYIKSFFVRSIDPTHLKLLKLEILTNLASASSIAMILREFQAYIASSDPPFVAATIQAIGRCAASIKEVTETCLSGLVHLLSNRDEHVVAESVVVIKRLLQSKSAEHYEIIQQMAKLIDFINVPAARAAIIWLIGEYNEKVPKIAPDVLRKMAKTFSDEENNVKLQILNLAVKLYITNPEQTSLLCQYVFTLARYDINYDIRDRARYLRQFIFPSNKTTTILSQHARAIFLAAKPAPVLESKYSERNKFQLGSLSHYLNMRATGYQDLPPFPKEVPDASVRNIDGYINESSHLMGAGGTPIISMVNSPKKNAKANNAESSEYSSSGSNSSASGESAGSGSSSSSSSSSSSESSDDSDNEAEKPDARKEKQNNTPKKKEINNGKEKSNKEPAKKDEVSGTSDSESSSNSSDSEESKSDNSSGSSEEGSSADTESDSEKRRRFKRVVQKANETKANFSNASPKKSNEKVEEKSNLDLLLDLDDVPPVGPVMTPSLGGFLTPGVPISLGIGLVPQNANNRIDLVGPSYIEFKYKELVNKLTGNGLQISYRYIRAPHIYSSSMVSIELQFTNASPKEITGIELGQKNLPAGMNLNEFAPIQQLLSQQTTTRVLGIDFNDSTHSIDFDINSSNGKCKVTLKPPIGELVRSVQISESFFKEERTKLRGMNEHQCGLAFSKDFIDLSYLKQKVFECINVASIASTTENVYYFVGQTMSSKSLVLITLDWSTKDGNELLLNVNCEKMVIGSMVMNEIRNFLNANLKM